jgi:putative ABC transport system permease protein
MFRHLLKLIWKRKGRNLMLSLEILLAFIVVFAIAAFGVRNWQLYKLPTGFVHTDVWTVQIESGDRSDQPFEPAVYDAFRRGLQTVPGVKEVAFASTSPYLFRTMHTSYAVPGSGRRARTDVVEVDDHLLPLLSIKPVEGRLFARTDDGAGATPVILNRRMAMELFGNESPLGKEFDGGGRDSKVPEPMRVVGVIDDYRNKGELDPPANVTITRFAPSKRDGMHSILIKVAPGTPRAFEETLSRQLKLINNAWSYDITPLDVRRKSAMTEQLMPIIVMSVVAAFLLVMVAFGLFGVLWQNTTRRIPEIGLRRAIGANAGHIYRQIIAEQFLLSTGAMLVALLLLVQLPITGALGEALSWPVFLAATALSMLVIYLLSLLCSVYPGWRASRLSPTDALHYE